jgi:Flp pilus assembly pilin Flp
MKGVYLWIANRQGQTIVEYCLLISLVAIAAFAAVMGLGLNAQSALYNPASRMIP